MRAFSLFLEEFAGPSHSDIINVTESGDVDTWHERKALKRIEPATADAYNRNAYALQPGSRIPAHRTAARYLEAACASASHCRQSGKPCAGQKITSGCRQVSILY